MGEFAFQFLVAGEPIRGERPVFERAADGAPGLVPVPAVRKAALCCEVGDLVEGRVHAVSRGRDKLPYFGFNLKITEVITNDANDNSVTALITLVDKDLRVTDNGDGTLTLLILATGNAVLYGEDGKAIARNPGQGRYEILIDHAGTPTDPFDDEFVEFIGDVKSSTGRSDDFCEAAVPVLLGS